MRTKRKPMADDRLMSIFISIAIVGLALQVAAVTAYIPLGIIGRGHDDLLLWVMPTWIIGVTVIANLIVRRLFRKIT